MALKKPLVLGSDGSIEQLQSGDTLDVPSPTAGDVISLVIADSVGIGDVLCATASGIVKADKDDATLTKVIGLSTNSGVSGDQVDIRVSAQMGGLTSLNPGDSIYLGNSGAYTQSIPTFGTVVRLGVAISTTDMLVEISQPIKL